MTESRPPRRIALAIFGLSPAGGLEQHCLRLAAELMRRGSAVTAVTTGAPQSAPAGLAVETIARRGHTSHGRMAAFAADAGAAVAGRFDRTVAFHAIPGFDLVFCADPSRGRPGFWKSLLPRYRTFAALERAAFGPASPTRVLCLSSVQLEAIARNDAAARERLLLLPPTVDRLRIAAAPPDRDLARAGVPIWLWMGLQPGTKGLDRTLAALARAPEARLLVCGLDPASPGGRAARRLARRLGVEARVRWLGFLADAEVPRTIAGADLLVHPARADVTGTVILEAMAGGLPVIATGVCGYGEHVRNADAGVVLAEPFRARALDEALARAGPDQRRRWSANGLAYAGRGDLCSGLERAADIILGAPAPA
ncbi:MAG TPA: glycosyltransferase family 4 protein [Caulobacteraceae bacterium]|nr:glycosyltransferase family 4 protein [Caulobacteraceae bacterium]